jgi:hypothetical protein
MAPTRVISNWGQRGSPSTISMVPATHITSERGHVVWFRAGDDCMRQGLLTHRPLNSHDASQQSSQECQNEQQP